MPKVTFLPQNETMEFESGELPYQNHGLPESLLDVALNFGVPLEHACGGNCEGENDSCSCRARHEQESFSWLNCACTTCHVIVREQDSHLSPMEECEEDRLDLVAGLTLHSRLGCQAVIKGDVTVEIPDWNRNYLREGATKTELR